MQQSPLNKRQFAGEQPVRRFPQNNQPIQGYEQQGAYTQAPRFQSSQTTVPAQQHAQTIEMRLSPELQEALCKDCPYRTAAESTSKKKGLFSRRSKEKKHKRPSLLVLILALIGFATVVIQGLRYVILPLVDYFFQLTGGGVL